MANEAAYRAACEKMEQAKYEREYRVAADAFRACGSYSDAEKKAAECLRLAETVHKDAIYRRSVSDAQNARTPQELRRAMDGFGTIRGWRDADAYYTELQARLNSVAVSSDAQGPTQTAPQPKKPQNTVRRCNRIMTVGGIVLWYPITVALLLPLTPLLLGDFETIPVGRYLWVTVLCLCLLAGVVFGIKKLCAYMEKTGYPDHDRKLKRVLIPYGISIAVILVICIICIVTLT